MHYYIEELCSIYIADNYFQKKSHNFHQDPYQILTQETQLGFIELQQNEKFKMPKLFEIK